MSTSRGIFLVAAISVLGLFAHSRSRIPDGHHHVQPEVLMAAHHDVSAPLRDMKSASRANSRAAEEGPDAEGFEAPRREASAILPDPVMQRTAGALLGTTAGLNFEGVDFNTNWVAPDSNGAVGATQFVQWVNVEFAVYDKTSGAILMGPTAGSTLWQGFGGVCQTSNSGDPVVQYDKAAARWVFSQHATPKTGQPLQCLAVSTTSDATGTYNRYSFPLPINDLPDYPKLGVWPDAYYLSINEALLSNFQLVGGYVCALDRSEMLVGGPATAQCFQQASTVLSLLPSDLDGATAPPAGSPNYFLNLGTNALNLWKFHVDFVNPANTTFTGPTSIPVTAFSQACGTRTSGVCIPQGFTTQQLQSLGDRLMYRLAYRNFGDHEALVVNHAVTAPKGAGVRWYEIRDPAGTPVVFQQGTFAPDQRSRWMASIAMDKAGDIAVGYSLSAAMTFPSIYYNGRVPGDPLGTLESEVRLVDGTGSQTSGTRWGDYSSMSIDPVDDCTFWYTSEYLTTNGSRNWKTRIASFKFNACH
jgi:hypothetical protein